MRFARYNGRRMAGDASWNLTRRWGAGMRTCWWACICVGVLTCSAAYQHFKQPSLPSGPLHDVDSAAAGLEPDQLPNAQKEARLEDAAGTVTIEHSELNDTKQNLSYLAYYAYSEVPPKTKPADTVLNSLKDIPPGTPVDEIKRVSGVLGFDFTFMKTVAKIEVQL